MSVVDQLNIHRQVNARDPENPPESQGHVTRTPTVGGHTVIGYTTLIQPQRIKDTHRKVQKFTAPDPTNSISVFTRQEGDLAFVVDGDNEYNEPIVSDVTNSRPKPKFRGVLYNCTDDAIINPIGFNPQYEAPAQQAGGFASVANLTTTGTINISNRTRKAFYPGQKLMAAMPTAEIMTPHLTDREKRGEWRPILIPVDNVLDELVDLDKMEQPDTASHSEARRLYRRSNLTADVAELKSDLAALTAPQRTKIRKCVQRILRKVGTNVKAANDAAIAMALAPIRENGSGLCQILQRV